MKLKKNKGVVFWITGLSGSGKTTLAELIYKFIDKTYGPTIIISGDDLRELFRLNKFDKISRLKYAQQYSYFCKTIVDQNINVIFATVSLFNKIRNWNRKNIDNYVEIYIKSNIYELIKKKRKFFYKKKRKNIVGKDLKAEFPKNPDITLINNFDTSLNKLSKIIQKQIKIKINK